MRNRSPEPIHNEASEETDSGVVLSTPTSSQDIEVPWDNIHVHMQYSPLYRSRYVENAFETWLVFQRPWSGNLREYPFLDCLFDLELVAFQIAVEWYYSRTPTPQGSITSRTPNLDEYEVSGDGDRIEEIFQGLVRNRVIILDAQGVPWSGPNVPATGQSSAAERSEAAGLGMRRFFRSEPEETPWPAGTDTGARSSHEPPHPENHPPTRGQGIGRMVDVGHSSPEDTGARSSNEPPYQPNAQSSVELESSDEESVSESGIHEHNHHVAQAAFLLWVEGYSFDWGQLTEAQQDAYHEMVGRYLQNINDVD